MKKILCLIVLTIYLCTLSVTYVSAEDKSSCSKWAKESVAMAEALGLLDENAVYSYKSDISREEFCELIDNLIQTTGYYERWYNEQTDNSSKPLPPFAKRPFSDTENDAVYALYNHDIVYGKNENEFAPNDSLTRQEAAVIIVRMVNIVNPLPSTEMYYSYDDGDEISQWASESVQIISNLGLMKGTWDNKFAPQGTYTTEQAIVTVLRIYNAFNNSSAFKILDKEGNVVITADDLVSCDVKRGETSAGNEEWYVELVFNDEAREKFRRVTKIVSEYDKSYLSVMVGDSIISSPHVPYEMDSDTVMIAGEFTEEVARSFTNAINSVL
ncbi:MAG: S-layer homology domain-containing protein [Clostridia bacterium]|nr:S-layer homology domain-containing protein [Clostridia bacterium]